MIQVCIVLRWGQIRKVFSSKACKNMKKKTTKQFIDEAILLHSGRYIYLKTIYSNAHDKVIITCQIHGDFKQTPRNHLFGRNGKGQGCHKCMLIEKADNIRLTNEEIDQYLIDNDITIKRIGNYINSAIHLNWKCLLCDNVWSSVPNSIRQGIGCPKCNDTKLNNKDIDDYIFIHTLQLKRIDDYINIYTKINWQCLVCNYIWLAQPCEIKRKGLCRDGSGCPECSRGKNEKRVGEVLNLLNIQHRKIRINLPTGQKIFPDFFLPQLNTII